MVRRKPGIRNRVKELRNIAAGELLENPKNWRNHNSEQRTGLLAVLNNIGFASAAVGIERKRGKHTDVILIDGHLRKDLVDPKLEIPVLIVDLTQREADLVLATMDPLASLATPDEVALASLLNSIDEVDDDITALLAQIESTSIPSEKVSFTASKKKKSHTCPECGTEFSD